MATNCRFRQMFWCNFSCRSMNDSYERCVNVTFRRIAEPKYGRTCATCDAIRGRKTKMLNFGLASGATVTSMRSFSPPGGYTSLYSGAFSLLKNARNARAMPSIQSRSYLKGLGQQTECVDATRCMPICWYFYLQLLGAEVSTVLVSRGHILTGRPAGKPCLIAASTSSVVYVHVWRRVEGVNLEKYTALTSSSSSMPNSKQSLSNSSDAVAREYSVQRIAKRD